MKNNMRKINDKRYAEISIVFCVRGRSDIMGIRNEIFFHFFIFVK